MSILVVALFIGTSMSTAVSKEIMTKEERKKQIKDQEAEQNNDGRPNDSDNSGGDTKPEDGSDIVSGGSGGDEKPQDEGDGSSISANGESPKEKPNGKPDDAQIEPECPFCNEKSEQDFYPSLVESEMIEVANFIEVLVEQKDLMEEIGHMNEEQLLDLEAWAICLLYTF